jgi:dihydropteroate synthase
VASASATAILGTVRVGDRFPVRVMAAVNVSPESFYKGSVAGTANQVADMVRRAIDCGADILDIGGASTAPYLKGGWVSKDVEEARVSSALQEVLAAVTTKNRRPAISVDTIHASVADMALRSGATIINDVSGLKNDKSMAQTIRDRGASLLAMAHSSRASITMEPIEAVGRCLKQTLAIAARAGLDDGRIVLDPGIGFFREGPRTMTSSTQRVMPWYRWDCEVIANLRELRRLGRPVGVGMSRKSFLGKILGLDSPEDRLAGSLSITAIAVMNGAHLIRTHDVKETVEAVRVAEAVKARVHRAS